MGIFLKRKLTEIQIRSQSKNYELLILVFRFEMVRTHKRKRDNPSVSRDVIMGAISDVQNEEFSLRTAALKHRMTHTLLYYHLQN